MAILKTVAIYIAGLSIFFKSTSTSLFTGGTFLLRFEQFSWISYTTLFKIRRYQRPFYAGKSTWYKPWLSYLRPVYTIQVLHPSLHSRKLGSRKLEFKFVYTRCKKFWWIHTSFGGRNNKQNGIFWSRGGCCPLYCIIMYNCTAKEIKLQKEVNMGS